MAKPDGKPPTAGEAKRAYRQAQWTPIKPPKEGWYWHRTSATEDAVPVHSSGITWDGQARAEGYWWTLPIRPPERR